MLSELVSHKQIDVAIEAFNRLRLPLVIAGGGPDRRRLRRLAGPTIRFAGRVSDAEAARLLASCRALVVTTGEEFGIAAVEAQAAGRPVIARAAGGLLENVVDGVTGCLWEGGADELAEAVTRFDPDSVDSRGVHRERAPLRLGGVPRDASRARSRPRSTTARPTARRPGRASRAARRRAAARPGGRAASAASSGARASAPSAGARSSSPPPASDLRGAADREGERLGEVVERPAARGPRCAITSLRRRARSSRSRSSVSARPVDAPPRWRTATSGRRIVGIPARRALRHSSMSS